MEERGGGKEESGWEGERKGQGRDLSWAQYPGQVLIT